MATLRHVTATLRRRQFQTAEQTESSGARPHPRPPGPGPLPSRDPPGFPTPPAPPGTRPAWRESLSGPLARPPGWRSPEPALGATAQQQRRRLQTGGERGGGGGWRGAEEWSRSRGPGRGKGARARASRSGGLAAGRGTGVEVWGPTGRRAGRGCKLFLPPTSWPCPCFFLTSPLGLPWKFDLCVLPITSGLLLLLAYFSRPAVAGVKIELILH